jgi:hypothetical protein
VFGAELAAGLTCTAVGTGQATATLDEHVLVYHRTPVLWTRARAAHSPLGGSWWPTSDGTRPPQPRKLGPSLGLLLRCGCGQQLGHAPFTTLAEAGQVLRRTSTDTCGSWNPWDPNDLIRGHERNDEGIPGGIVASGESAACRTGASRLAPRRRGDPAAWPPVRLPLSRRGRQLARRRDAEAFEPNGAGGHNAVIHTKKQARSRSTLDSTSSDESRASDGGATPGQDAGRARPLTATPTRRYPASAWWGCALAPPAYRVHPQTRVPPRAPQRASTRRLWQLRWSARPWIERVGRNRRAGTGWGHVHSRPTAVPGGTRPGGGCLQIAAESQEHLHVESTENRH